MARVTITIDLVREAVAELAKAGKPIRHATVREWLKDRYGNAGDNSQLCSLLKSVINESATELKRAAKAANKSISSALTELVGQVQTETPQEIVDLFREIADLVYGYSYQQADVSISGQRLEELSAENDALKRQLTDFPTLKLEHGFYKEKYGEIQEKLHLALIQLDRQKLADSEQAEREVALLRSSLADAEAKLTLVNSDLDDLAKLRVKVTEYERLHSELSEKYNEQLAEVAQVEILRERLKELSLQLAEANDLNINLQGKLNQNQEQISVDNQDVGEILAELARLQTENQQLKEQLEKPVTSKRR